MANDSDVALADLRELLAILGMGDHARPQSPHEVFQEALGVLREQLSRDTVSGTPPAHVDQVALDAMRKVADLAGVRDTTANCQKRAQIQVLIFGAIKKCLPPIQLRASAQSTDQIRASPEDAALRDWYDASYEDRMLSKVSVGDDFRAGWVAALAETGATEPCDCKIGDCKRITRRCLEGRL